MTGIIKNLVQIIMGKKEILENDTDQERPHITLLRSAYENHKNFENALRLAAVLAAEGCHEEVLSLLEAAFTMPIVEVNDKIVEYILACCHIVANVKNRELKINIAKFCDRILDVKYSRPAKALREYILYLLAVELIQAQGTEAERQDDHEDVLFLLRSIPAGSENYPNACVILGKYYLALDELPAAKKYFQSALAAAPHTEEALLGLAEVACIERKFSICLSYVEALKKLVPGNPHFIEVYRRVCRLSIGTRIPGSHRRIGPKPVRAGRHSRSRMFSSGH